MLDICTTKEIEKHLAPFPGAKEFLFAFSSLCHAVDDLIDQDNPEVKDPKMHVLDTFGLAVDIYSCPFYQHNISWLYPVVKNIHRVYSDSVVWEKSEVEYRRQVADALRCCGNEILLAILEHLCRLPGADLRRLSLAAREDLWEKSHGEKGEAV